MAINFEAANMVGYNNPKIEVFKATLNAADHNKVTGAPSYTTISNTLKSGFLPVLYVTLETGDAVAAPLTAIDHEGDYLFSCVFQLTTVSGHPPVMMSILYVKNNGSISAAIVNL